MFNKLVDAFARTRMGFIAAAAAVVLAVPLALAAFTATPIADIPTEIDFTDVSTDLGVLLVAVLLAMLIIWGLSVGTHSIKHFAKGNAHWSSRALFHRFHMGP
jgi:uncharacterized protein HemY